MRTKSSKFQHVASNQNEYFPKKNAFFHQETNSLTGFLRLAPGNVDVPPGPHRLPSSNSSCAAASSPLPPHHVLHDGLGHRRLLLRRRHGRPRTRTSAESGDPTGTPGRRRDRWEAERGSRWRGALFLILADGIMVVVAGAPGAERAGWCF